MSSSDKTALFTGETTATSNRCGKSIRSHVPEQLSLELDFGRISHEPATSSAHPHVLFSPLHYEPGYAYPLFVWLHGTGGDERQVMRIMPMLSMRNYVAVAPQGIAIPEEHEQGEKRSTGTVSNRNFLDVASILRGEIRSKVVYDWCDTDNGFSVAEQRIFECISIARQRNNIAPQRIFLAGFGSGGTMALRLALLYPESFAGAASLGGSFPAGRQVLHRWSAARNLSVFLGVGCESTHFTPKAACETLKLFHTAGLATTVREYPCGQELTPPMFQDLNRWMMDIVCGE